MTKIRLEEIRVGDTVEFDTPGRGKVSGEVALIQTTTGLSKRLFYTEDHTLLNKFPDGGTDAKLLKAGGPTPEETEAQRKTDEAFAEFNAKPVGSMYMLYSHKATGTVLVKLSEDKWLHYDYSSYGGYEAYRMGHEEAFFNHIWDSDELTIWADEMEIRGI